MQIYLQSIIALYLAAFVLLFLYQFFRFRYLKKYYGKENAKLRFYRNMRLGPFLPEKESKGYKKLHTMLVNAGWGFPVEQFVICKYFIVFLVLAIGCTVIQTNKQVEKQAVLQDLNYKRATADYKISQSPERVMEEMTLIYEVSFYLDSLGMSTFDELARPSAEAFMIDAGITYDSPQAAARRILLKLQRIQEIEENGRDYVLLILFAYLAFRILELLAYIKTLLLYSKKDWEDLNCLAVYSIVSRLPPFKIDVLISCMESVCTVYKPLLSRYGNALQTFDAKEQDELLHAVEDDTMQEILETLALAQTIGIEQTAENIDDILDTQIGYMEVTANKRRQTKMILAVIPVVGILFFLFQYLMFGVVYIIQNSMIMF